MKFNKIPVKPVYQEIEESKDGVKKLIPLIKKSFKNDYDTIPSKHRKLDGYISVSQFAGDACLKKLYINHINGYPKSYEYKLNYIFAFGTLFHEYIQDVLSRNGFLKGIEQFLQYDEKKICGSIDGYIENDDDTITLVDFKTTSLGFFEYVLKSRKAKKAHKHQLMTYAYLFEKQFGKKVKAIKVLYINKNQNSFSMDIDDQITKINSCLDYLTDTNDKMVKLKRTSEDLEENISILESSRDSLLNLLTKEDNFDYLFYEVDYAYDEVLALGEIARVDGFWDKVAENENNEKIAREKEANGKPYIKPTIKYPPTITTKTYCPSCQFYTEYCEKKKKQ